MYRVVHLFTDLQDSDHRYDVGDIFPRDGLTVSEERLRELSTANNKQHCVLIEHVDDPVKEQRRGRKRKDE